MLRSGLSGNAAPSRAMQSVVHNLALLVDVQLGVAIVTDREASQAVILLHDLGAIRARRLKRDSFGCC
jgi:hypothetical protein